MALGMRAAMRRSAGQHLKPRHITAHAVSRTAVARSRITPFVARSRVASRPCRLFVQSRSGASASDGTQWPKGTRTSDLLRVEIPTSDVRQSLRVGGMAVGRGRAIVLTVVAPNSAAYEAGLREGCRIVAISDPARSEELWVLNERVSLRFVRDSLRMRISPTIILVVEPPSEDWVSSSANNAAAETGEARFDVSGSQDAQSLEEELESARRRQARMKSEVEQRIKARKAYLGEVGQRDDSKLFAGLAAAFFLPAIIILTIAFASGYLDTLQMNVLRGL